MVISEHIRLAANISILKDVAKEYPGKTIDNIIIQLEARIKEVEHAY